MEYKCLILSSIKLEKNIDDAGYTHNISMLGDKSLVMFEAYILHKISFLTEPLQHVYNSAIAYIEIAE